MLSNPCRSVVATAILLSGLHVVAWAQGAKRFEVSSIRPMPRGAPSLRQTGTLFEVVSTPLSSLLARAFGVEPFQIVGPDWLTTERFAVRATIPAGASPRDVPGMLQSLLAERFNLKTHREQRKMPIYELVVGKAGLRISEVPAVDDVESAIPGASGQTVGGDSTSGLPGDEERVVFIGDGKTLSVRTITRRSLYDMRVMPGGSMQLEATRISMAEFIRNFNYALDRPVADKTGLQGVYQLKALIPPPNVDRATVERFLPGGVNRSGQPIDQSPSGVSLFRSVEALGLRLEARNGPIDVIVVDAVERTPTPD